MKIKESKTIEVEVVSTNVCKCDICGKYIYRIDDGKATYLKAEPHIKILYQHELHDGSMIEESVECCEKSCLVGFMNRITSSIKPIKILDIGLYNVRFETTPISDDINAIVPIETKREIIGIK